MAGVDGLTLPPSLLLLTPELRLGLLCPSGSGHPVPPYSDGLRSRATALSRCYSFPTVSHPRGRKAHCVSIRGLRVA
eukprot:1788336-Rhodomonas_salina.1